MISISDKHEDCLYEKRSISFSEVIVELFVRLYLSSLWSPDDERVISGDQYGCRTGTRDRENERADADGRRHGDEIRRYNYLASDSSRWSGWTTTVIMGGTSTGFVGGGGDGTSIMHDRMHAAVHPMNRIKTMIIKNPIMKYTTIIDRVLIYDREHPFMSSKVSLVRLFRRSLASLYWIYEARRSAPRRAIMMKSFMCCCILCWEKKMIKDCRNIRPLIKKNPVPWSKILLFFFVPWSKKSRPRSKKSRPRSKKSRKKILKSSISN